MANSSIEICNKALDLLGHVADIGNIDNPTTENEQICARWYNDTLEFLLRRYVWNFAIKRVKLALDKANTPPFEFTSAYKLPNDFVRLLAINGRSDFGVLDFEISNGFILLNSEDAPSVDLKYIHRITDVKKFDTGFTQLFTLYLATNLAYRFTAKQTVIERLLKWIELEEAKVVSIDGQEQPPKRIQRSKYGRARRNASTTWGQYRPVKKTTEETD